MAKHWYSFFRCKACDHRWWVRDRLYWAECPECGGTKVKMFESGFKLFGSPDEANAYAENTDPNNVLGDADPLTLLLARLPELD